MFGIITKFFLANLRMYEKYNKISEDLNLISKTISKTISTMTKTALNNNYKFFLIEEE